MFYSVLIKNLRLISQNMSVQSDLMWLQYRTLPLEETTFGFLTSVTILFRTIKIKSCP